LEYRVAYGNDNISDKAKKIIQLLVTTVIDDDKIIIHINESPASPHHDF